VNRDGRLVGRADGLAMAERVLDDAFGGSGQLLLVSGEPGIGKSAFLGEVAHRAGSRGARVLRGVCWDGAGAPPYWPWTQVLREVDQEGARASEAGWLLAGRPAGGAGSALEAADDRFRLFDGVARSLITLARDQPLVLVLDDLQWADTPSLDLLEFAFRQVSACRVLILGAFRDTEPVDALYRLRGQVLQLAGLNPTDVAALMTVVSGTPPSLERARSVCERCGGNPFFVRELTRLVLARGGWNRAATGMLPIPEGVRETLNQRLARLSPRCTELADVLATAGTAMSPDVLSRVSGIPRDSLADLLDEAVGARVVVLEPRPRIAHDLFREAILGTLPTSRRAELHLAVGRALQDNAGDATVEALSAVSRHAQLAAHFVAAGPVADPEALEYSILAARDATARLGHDDAARHYRNALERLRDDPARQTAIRLELAAAWDRAGDSDSSRAVYAHVAELARAEGDAAGLARAALGMHALGSRGVDHTATEMLTAAAAGLQSPPSPGMPEPEGESIALRSRTLAALARTYRHSYETLDPRARNVAQEAVDLARAAGDPAALALALLAAHDVAWEPGSARERLAIVAAMAQAAASAGDQDLVAEARMLQAAALIELGDPAGREVLGEYVFLAEGLGHARGRWGALSRRAVLAELSGRVDDAIELADEALVLGRAIGIPDAEGCFSTLRGAMGALGCPVPKQEGLLPTTDPLWPVFPLLRAWSCLYDGDLDKAGSLMHGFAIEDIGDKHDLELLAAAATVCAAVGSASQQQWVYHRLEPHGGLHVVVGGCAAYHGAVDHLLGLLAAALGRTQRADEHFATATEMLDRLGAPAWAALSRRERDRLKPTRPRNKFHYDGGTWQLTFDGLEVHLPDAKGLHDIATLLGTPGREVHVYTLLGQQAPAAGADPVLDEQARAQYLERLAWLATEITEADALGDPLRSERACAERDTLVHELSAATGLGGRRRRLGDETERARQRVRARIRDVLVRIETVHPSLAKHLRDSIGTGSSCVYKPPEPHDWLL
jgi:hypothetical protein